MKKILSIVAIALVAITSAYAQEDNNRDENGAVVRGPYLTNGFWDNWFVSAVGFRFGLHGLNNSFDLKPGHTTLIDNGNGNFEFFQYIHTDLLWNITNTLCGYKETRFWNVVPYIGAGWVGLKDPTYKDREGYDEVNDEWGVAAGVLNNFRISNRLCFCLDFSVLSIRNEVLEVSPWIGENDIFAFMPSITAGLCINLGRTNFNRFSSVLPEGTEMITAYDRLNGTFTRMQVILLDTWPAADKPIPFYINYNSEVYTEALASRFAESFKEALDRLILGGTL